eukprot:2208250-Rhodomonas_salina.4
MSGHLRPTLVSASASALPTHPGFQIQAKSEHKTTTQPAADQEHTAEKQRRQAVSAQRTLTSRIGPRQCGHTRRRGRGGRPAWARPWPRCPRRAGRCPTCRPRARASGSTCTPPRTAARPRTCSTCPSGSKHRTAERVCSGWSARTGFEEKLARTGEGRGWRLTRGPPSCRRSSCRRSGSRS